MVRDEVAGLEAVIQQSWGAALEDLRRDVEVLQQRTLAARRRANDQSDALADAIQRLAGVLEGLAALERDRWERPAQIDVLECLFREMLIGGYAPLPGPARLVGGTIDARQAGIGAPDIDLSALEGGAESGVEGELAVGTSVQVRSHFQDRWSAGFEITEVVHDEGRRQFKLKRWYDDRALPLLFDAADVRLHSIQPAGSGSRSEEGPQLTEAPDAPRPRSAPSDRRS